MKKIISSIMAVILIIMACSGLLFSLKSFDFPIKDTPIAKIPNDTYTPYSYSNQAEAERAEVLKNSLQQLGGEVKTYSSEAEYQAAQSKKKNSQNYSTVADTAFKPVQQTITVMTTATGSKGNGNYKASEPIQNAIVRIDGVPRFTDRKGQVHVTIYKEYAELCVEKTTESIRYNPHIEIIDVTGEDITVYLKVPSDDIDVYAAMLNIAGDSSNLLAQSYNIPIDYMDYSAELVLLANVDIDLAFLYVNGELDSVAPNEKFLFFDYNSYNVGDEFSVKIKYNGIMSKEYKLNLHIVDPQKIIDETLDSNLNRMVEEYSQISAKSDIAGPDISFDENQDLGLINGFKFDFAEVIRYILDLKKGAKLLSPNEIKKNMLSGVNELKFDVLFDPRTGLFQITLGITIGKKIRSAEASKYKETLNEINEAKKKNAKNETDYRDLNIKLKENILHNDKQDELAVKKTKEEMSEVAKRYDKNSEIYKKSEEYITNQNKNQYNSYKRDISLLSEEVLNTKNAIDGLPDVIKAAKKGFSQFNSMVTLYFEFYGVFTFDSNCRIIDARVAGGFEVKLTFSKQILLWYIPMYFKATVDGKLEIKMQFIEKGGLTFSNVKTFFENMSLYLNVNLQGEVGVGLYDVLSAGGFLRFDLNYDFPIGGLFPDSDKKASGEFKISTGVKVKALIFEYKHEWELHKTEFGLNDTSYAMNISDRNYSLGNNSERLSEYQSFASPYQESKPQLIELGDDKSILIWLADDESRDKYNRTVLRYAIRDKGVWSESKALTTESGLSDFYPNVYKDGDDLHITWQRSNRVFDSNDDLTAMSKGGEIWYAKFNNELGKFEDITQLTSDNEMDLAPKFALKEKSSDPLTIVWQKNNVNDIMGKVGINTIMCATKEHGKWSEAKTAYSTETLIAYVTASIKNGKLTLAMVSDTDKDALTDSDRKVMLISDGNISELDAGVLGNTQFAIVNGKAKLFYYSDNKIVMTEDFIAFEEVLSSVSQEFFLGFNVISDSNGLAILYRNVYGECSQGFIAVYNKLTDSWNKNIVITDEKYNVLESNGYFDKSGKLNYAYSIMNEDNVTALCVKDMEFGYGIEVAEIFNIQNIAQDTKVTFGIRLKNTGSYAVDKFVVEMFYNSIEIILVSALNSNEENQYFIEMMPQLTTELVENVNVIAYNKGIEVARTTYEYHYEYCDLRVDVGVDIINAEQIFNITVINDSRISSRYRLEIYVNYELKKTYIGELKANEINEIEHEFDNISVGDYVFINVIPVEEERNKSNNYYSYYSVISEQINQVKENPYKQYLDIVRGMFA